MTLLMNYQDFIERVNELGFMPYNSIDPRLPSLHDETPSNIWYSGNRDTDPCCWKDRVAGEKKLAYGCIIGGHKGFVSARMYPIFFAAYHPKLTMNERMENGQVNEIAWKLWFLFEGGHTYNTSEIRRILGSTPQKGGNKIDKCITDLQRYYYITISNTEQRKDKYGSPYGSPVNVYQKALNWVPEAWMNTAELSSEEAKEFIINTAISIGNDMNYNVVERLLFAFCS